DRLPRIDTLIAPGPRQSIEQVALTKTRVVVALYDNVKGGLVTFAPGPDSWTRGALPVAASSSVGVAAASDVDDTLYYSVETFLQPTTLLQADAASGAHVEVKALPARFDASQDTVEQFEAVSSDGTKVPYFVVHRKDLKPDGSNP